MKPYPFKDYKLYLADIIENNLGRGAKAQLADAAGCQRSFLSQVLNGPTHLTLDHAIGIAQFLKLTADDREYFLALVGLARSGSVDLTKYYNEKLEVLKSKSENLSTRLNTSTSSPDLAEYYSSWKFSATHILCTIPKFQTIPVIAERLNLSLSETEDILYRLREMMLVENKKGRWFCTANEIHLPKEHFMTFVNHQNWREKNVKEAQKNPTRNITYTATYSMSRDDFEKLKELCLDFLENSRAIVAPSKEEELVGFTLDCVLL